MKTSNIIIASFLIFLFSGIILLYIGSKYYKSYDDPSNFTVKEKELASFSVVVAQSGAVFELSNGKQNKISQHYLKGTSPNISSFEVRNDTLFISSQEPKNDELKHRKNMTEVFCSAKINSISAKDNSSIKMTAFADTLNITMNKSSLEWRFDKTKHVSIQSENSSIYLDGDNIETAAITLDKTELFLKSKNATKYLSGALKNGSNLEGVINGKIDIEKDASSHMYFRQWD